MACQRLRSGESDVALAAGVNGLLTPAPEPEAAAAEEMPDDSFSVLDALFDSVEGDIR